MDTLYFFTLKFECHKRYKLLSCNSEIGDIAWCNKNNSEWEFCVFSKNTKNRIKKTGGLFFLKDGFILPWLSFNPFCDFPLIARSGTSHVNISLIGSAPHT